MIGMIQQLYSQAANEDILQGKGIFTNSNSFSKWQQTGSEHVVTKIQGANQVFLKVEKKSEASISFKEGFQIKFDLSKPEHISFHFSSTDKDKEDTNLRLKNSDKDKTVVSFRCGNAGFVRVNDNQMISFYNDSVSEKDTLSPKFVKADILINWEEETVDIFLDGNFKGSGQFYHKDPQPVDTLMLYNLKPGTVGYWKDIEICPKRCHGFIGSIMTHFHLISVILLLLILSISI